MEKDSNAFASESIPTQAYHLVSTDAEWITIVEYRLTKQEIVTKICTFIRKEDPFN